MYFYGLIECSIANQEENKFETTLSFLIFMKQHIYQSNLTNRYTTTYGLLYIPKTIIYDNKKQEICHEMDVNRELRQLRSTVGEATT
jgi:hypothetical protein